MLIKMLVTLFEIDIHNVKLHPQKMLVTIIATQNVRHNVSHNVSHTL